MRPPPASPSGVCSPGDPQALAEIGVNPAGLRSKGLKEFDLTEYSLLVNLSEHSLRGRVPAAYAGRVLLRPVLDPYGGSLEVYRQSRDAINRLISRELCREDGSGP